MKSSKSIKAVIYLSIIIFAMTFIGCADGLLGQRADDNNPTTRDLDNNWSVEEVDENDAINDEAAIAEPINLVVVE